MPALLFFAHDPLSGMRRRTLFSWPVLAGVVFAHAVFLAWMLAGSFLPVGAAEPPMVGILVSPASSASDGQFPEKAKVPKKAASNPAVQNEHLLGEKAKPEKTTPSPAASYAQADAATDGKSHRTEEGLLSGAKGNESDASGSGPFFSPHVDAAHLNNPKPKYPPASRRMGEEGTVILSVHILADGTASEVRLKKSSGYSRLDESAMQAVRKWRYVPARRGNTPIPWWYTQAVTFSLTD